jgi:sugar lactone lactonase YvrE
MTPAGAITILAGNNSTAATLDGTGAAARFNNPRQPCVIPTTEVVVIPEQNNIRLLTTSTWAVNSGVVTTLAGVPGTSGFLNGQGTAARFSGPQSVTYDPNTSNVIVADGGNNAIRAITYPGGYVSTLATGLNNPNGITYNPFTGNYVVADAGSHRILGVTPQGAVTTIAGTGTAGSAGGNALTNATFTSPSSVVVDPSGNIIVLDGIGIRSISRAGIVSTLATTTFGGSPTSIAINSTNNNLIVTDLFGQSIWKIV